MKILLFSDIGLPDSCALATRVMNFAKLFKNLGHDIELLGVCYSKDKPLSGSYDGIDFEMLKAASFNGIKAFKRINQLNKDIENFLEERSKTESYDVILLSNVYYDFSKVFMKYSKKYGAKLVVNAVEWYEKNNAQFRGALGKINYIKNRIALKRIHVKMGNIVAISSLLDNYYKERNCNTVTIPTIIDLKEYETVNSVQKDNDGILHIAYAGDPGKKDYVVNAMYALELLSDEERKRIKLDFYGTTYEKLYANGLSREYIEKYKDSIICHGRIPYEQVKERIAEADFTVLLRPQMRYANAGFPTKVGESMACGTPVICNITSDLGKYVVDGVTGFVCENETKEACAKAFRRALSLNREQIKQMREDALKMAQESFNYEAYTLSVRDFLKE